MCAFTYLYITDTLSGLNLTENKQEMALFSPSVVLKYDLSPFSTAPWHFLQILLFCCLLSLKINHILVIMIHFQAFIFLLWWGREKVVGPLFFSFSTSSHCFWFRLFLCVGEGGEGAILLQDWFCCGPSFGALWVWYSLVLSFFVACLLVIWKSFKDFSTV